MPTEWEERTLRDEAEKDRYIKEVSRNRKFFSSGRYRSTVGAETLLTLLFLRVVSLPTGGSDELFELPTTRIDWARLILRGLVLLGMFHTAHTLYEGLLRRDGL